MSIPHLLVHSPKDTCGVVVVEGLKAGTDMLGVVTVREQEYSEEMYYQSLMAIYEKAIEVNADAIGLSALLVSTSKQMPLCVQELDRRGLKIPVLIGGAAINRRFDTGDVVRLMERRERNERPQLRERCVVDSDRLGVIRTSVHDTMADRCDRGIISRLL